MSAPTPKTDPPPAAPLSNPVAEAAIIAGLVNCGDPAAIGRYALDNRLDADCFTHTAYRAAYTAILDLAAAGQPVDVPILAGHLDEGALATVDSARMEHVSAANFTHYARILAGCKQRRAEAAARDRLAQAAAAGVPDHELLAIVESIRQASAGDSRECRLTEVGSLCDLPPSESWLMKRYIPADSLTVMFGSPGCGKSFAAIDIACHVATGREWRGQPVKQGRVVYVAGEGKSGLAKRFRAWFDRHGEQPRNISLLLTPIALTDPASVAALVADIRTLPEAPALVIIDTLNRNFGPGDENSTADMTKAVAGLDAIRTATGAAILGIHHSGHVEKGRGRGSSVLFGAVDAEYAAEMLGNTVQIRSTKMKDSDPPPQLAWALERQFLPWCDEEGTPMDSAVLVPTDIQICSASKTALTRPQRTAKAALEKLIERDGDNVLIGDWRREAIAAGLTQSESRQGKHAAFTRAVDALVDAGIIHVDGNNCRLCAPSTRQQTSTNSQHVDAVDGRSSLSPRQQTSTHPFRGVDNVDVDASRQPDMAELEKQETQPTDPLPDDPPLTNPQPADADALAAEGRRLLEEAKTAPSGVQVLPTGEYVVDPAPGSRVDLQNQGNRLLEQARKMRLAEDEKRESPPVDTPPTTQDISPDIPIAPPAESQGTPKACTAKAPDIARAKPLSPLDSDIVAYLSRVATTASEEEIHRQVHKGQQGRTLPLVRVALAKLVQGGLVDKINGAYRLAASGGAA